VLSSRPMNRNVSFLLTLLIGAVLLVPTAAEAQGFQQDEPPTIQIAPFAGYQFGGSVTSNLLEEKYSFGSGLSLGGTVDIAISHSWRLELYYSRQDTQLEAGRAEVPVFDLRIERYMVGFMEEKGEGSVKYFGSLLLGATRFVPEVGEISGETKLSAGLGLGVKTFFTKNVGLRFEGHAFYTVVESNGGVFCTAGTCLFSFSGRGIWQGDVAAGLIIAF
jgi:hypothetical protein